MLLSHEHVFCRFRGQHDLVLAALRDELAAAKRAGVSDIVDVTPYGPVGSFTGLLNDPSLPRVHGCVGFYRKRFIDRRHQGLTAEDLRAVMERQHARRTKSGLNVACIKVASDGDTLTPLERRVMQAAALFSSERRMPIVTHAIRGRHAQVAALLKGGAEPSRIMLSHVEMDLKGGQPRMTPRELAADLVPLLRRGVMLSITDMPVTKSDYQNAVIEFIGELASHRVANQVSVSSDARFTVGANRLRFSRGRDYTTVPKALLPALSRSLDATLVADITCNNAALFFGLPLASLN